MQCYLCDKKGLPRKAGFYITSHSGEQVWVEYTCFDKFKEWQKTRRNTNGSEKHSKEISD